jgi:hypothetical protein
VRGSDLQVAQTPLQDIVQVDGCPSSISKRLGGDIQSDIRA